MTLKSPPKPTKVSRADPKFRRVVEFFASDPHVRQEDGKGFGAGALKVNGKIFAMMSSKGEFVVKLPKDRVDGLIASGEGKRFDPGQGKLMKEWIVVPAGSAAWIELAREACGFVKRQTTTR